MSYVTNEFTVFMRALRGAALRPYCRLTARPLRGKRPFWECLNCGKKCFRSDEDALQAFLQRVLNGGGEIIREMALGKKAMDLGVLFRGAKYAVECKKVDFYEKSYEKAYDQICGYMDRLGVPEGWLVVFDPDLTKPWEGKIGLDEVTWKGKPIHVVRC